MNPLVAVAMQFLPQIVRYLEGGGGGKVADAVAGAVGSITRTQDPVEAKQKLEADPKMLLDLQVRLAEIAAKAEADQRQSDLDELKARLGDTQNARSALASGGMPAAVGSLGVSFIVAVAFVGLLLYIISNPTNVDVIKANGPAFQIVNITLGALTAAFVTVVSFWLGSSQGSRNKDTAAAEVQSRSADQTRQAMQAQTSQASRVAEKGLELTAAAERTGPTLVTTGGAVVTPLRKPPVGRFDQCVEVILRKEGGFVNNPRDPGGATNMGITLATLRAWRRRDQQDDAEVSAEEVRKLTEEEAKEIYFTNYWNALRCDELPAGLDLTVFDFGVNAGVGRAARVLQKCVFVETDGQVGAITLGAVRNFAAADLIRRFDEARMDFYRKLPGFADFGKGWENRVRSVETSALAMAQAA